MSSFLLSLYYFLLSLIREKEGRKTFHLVVTSGVIAACAFFQAIGHNDPCYYFNLVFVEKAIQPFILFFHNLCNRGFYNHIVGFAIYQPRDIL